jgi:serine/threonine-protein kinase
MLGQRLAHYEIQERVGHGGMGAVYRAIDLALGRPAALKLMLPDGDLSLRERLLAEARACACLQHPAIATFYDGGLEGDVAWLALEYVDGETLRARLARGALPAGDVIAIGIGLLEALAHAHAAGLLHRDLKPENVMIRPDGSVKLLDFGLARALSLPDDGDTRAMLTHDGLVVGTVGYMSPEQLRGDPLDARADLFAVGALLFELLTLRPAFPGRSAAERIAAVLAGPMPVVPSPPAPPALAQLLTRAMARERDERPASAAEFLRELRRVAEGQGTTVAAAGTDTLTVVDFVNLSGDPADTWLGTGIAEAVSADLARVNDLHLVARERLVKARTAAGPDADALDLAQTLGCRWVLAGSFQKSGPFIRIAARLSDVGSGHTTWAGKFDGPLDQLFTLQDRLAADVIAALNLRAPTPVPQPTAPPLSAYECYVRGRRLFERLDKGSMEQARELWEQAIALDPDLAAAHAVLSGLWAMRFPFTTDRAMLDRAIDHASRALAADSSLAEAHVWRGYAYWRLGQPDAALDEEHAALALDPALVKAPYFIATILMDLGRPLEALPFAQLAAANSEAYPFAWLVLGLSHLRLDQVDEARWCFERAEAEELKAGAPIVGAGAALAEAHRRLDSASRARECALRALERVEAADGMYRDTHRAFCLDVLARCALDAGDSSSAAALFGQAVAHLRGRPRALGGGHYLVQSLAGLAMAKAAPAPLDEALAEFHARSSFQFGWAFTASDVDSLVALATAALALGHPEGAALVRAAEAAGATAWERSRMAAAKA